MSERTHPRQVENYTTPFLVTFGFLLFAGFFAIWSVWGLLACALAAWLADRAISASSPIIDARRAARIRRGKAPDSILARQVEAAMAAGQSRAE